MKESLFSCKKCAALRILRRKKYLFQFIVSRDFRQNDYQHSLCTAMLAKPP
jgi:hypothetical protein